MAREQVGERGERQDGIAEEAVADRGPRRLAGIVGDVQQAQPGRHVRAGNIRVVAEHGGADDQREVVAIELVAQGAHRERQLAEYSG